jgi:hypothetical protein
MTHAARLDKSNRLQALHGFLLSMGDCGATTQQIARHLGSVAVHSDVSELRANGIGVTCEFEETNEYGRKVYRYRLVKP